MQALIKHMPKMAEKVFDQCYSVVNIKLKFQGKLSNVDYEFIDDIYYIPLDESTCEKINNQSNNYCQEVETILGPLRRKIFLNIYEDDDGDDEDSEDDDYIYKDFLSVYDKETFKLKPEAQSREKDYRKIIADHPLSLMLKYECYDLLSHGLVESYITSKWNRFIKYVYYSLLMYHFMFVSILTYTILNIPPKMIISASSNNVTLSDDYQKCLITPFPRYLITFMGFILSFLYGCEMVFRFNPFRRVLDLIIIVLIPSLSLNKYFDYSVQWNIILILNICVWAAFINVFKKMPRFGIYILMVFHTLKQFLRFIPIFVLFLTPFAISFYVLLHEERSFFLFFKTVIKSMAMMTGELNFDDNINEKSTIFNCFIFFIFMLLFTIFLMNILIGLAVSDTAATLQHASRLRTKFQIETIFHIESLMPESTRRYLWRGREETFKYNSEEGKISICFFRSLFRWFGLSKAAMGKLYTNNPTADAETETLLQKDMEKLERTCESMEMTQLKLKEINEQLETTAQTFAQLQSYSIPFIDEP